MNSTVSKREAEHLAARIVGIKEGEDKIAAAERAIAFMREHFPARTKYIKQAEQLLARAKAHGGFT